MANENVGIPLEIEAKFFDQLEQAIDRLEEVRTITKTAGDNIGKSFDTSGANEQLAKLSKELKSQKEITDQLAVSAQKAFDPKNSQGSVKAAQDVTKALKGSEQELQKIYDELSALDKKGQDLIKNVGKAADQGDTEAIRVLLNEFQQGLDPEQAQAFAEGIDQGMKDVEQSISRPARELRELKRQLAAGELEGEALQQATLRAAQLADEIGDVSQRVKNLSSDTFAVDAIVSGFEGIAAGAAIAQGAVGLFGDQNEELEKALLKVNSAMAILQGIQGVQKVLLEESAAKTAILTGLEKARSFVIDQTTGKLKAMNVAMLAGVGGAIITGITLLVTNWEKVSEAISGVSAAQAKENEIRKSAIKSASEEIAANEKLKFALQDVNTPQSERVRLINEAKEKYPTYLGYIDSEKTSTDEILGSLNKVNEALILKYQIQAREKDIMELVEQRKIAQDELAKAEEADLNRTKADQEYRASLSRAEQIRYDQEIQALSNRGDNLVANAQANVAKFDAQLNDVFAKIREDNKSLNVLGGDPVVEAKQKESNKKVIDEESKKQSKLIEDRKKFNTDLLALFDEADKAEIDSLTGEDKIAAQLAFDDQLLTAKENALKESLNQLELSGEERLQKEKLIEETIARERAQIVLNASEEINQLRIDEATKAAEASAKSLDTQQQILLAQEETKINLMRGSFATEEEFEKEKQTRLLNLQLQFAQAKLSLLSGTLTEEQQLEKANLEKLISDLQNQIASVSAPTTTARKPFIQELFGLDDEGFNQLQSSFQKAKDAALNFVGELYAARQAELDQEIALRDQNLADLQAKLDEENALRQDGKANSAKLVEAEIEEEKKRRADAIKEKQRIAKQQAIIDAGIQASSLITATAQIIAAESTKGLVGIITAGAGIISLLALVAKTKNQIKAATTIARHGHFRVLGGNRHEQGGTPVLSDLEAEQGEGLSIFSREAMNHYGAENIRAFTKAINTRRISMQPSAPSYQKARSFENNVMESEFSNRESVKHLRKLDSIQSDISQMREKLDRMPDEVINLPDGSVKIKTGNRITVYRKSE